MKVMADMKTATAPAWAEREALGARIVEIAALGDALSREKLACLRRFDELRGWADEGAVSCAHWLSLRTGLSRGAAREQVRVARALGRLPLIEAGFAGGELSYSKVRAMTRIATAGHGEVSLLGLAETLTAAQLEPLCRTL